MKNNLRMYRRKRDYTQADLARSASLSREYLSKIENGKQTPSVYVSNSLAKLLGTTSESLFPAQNVNQELQNSKETTQ